ncbi:hypothetical protein TELCIR_22663, partial [Teladorsagia circumcincta]
EQSLPSTSAVSSVGQNSGGDAVRNAPASVPNRQAGALLKPGSSPGPTKQIRSSFDTKTHPSWYAFIASFKYSHKWWDSQEVCTTWKYKQEPCNNSRSIVPWRGIIAESCTVPESSAILGYELSQLGIQFVLLLLIQPQLLTHRLGMAQNLLLQRIWAFQKLLPTNRESDVVFEHHNVSAQKLTQQYPASLPRTTTVKTGEMVRRPHPALSSLPVPTAPPPKTYSKSQKAKDEMKQAHQSATEKRSEIDEDEENLGYAETYADYVPAKLRSGVAHPDCVVETASLSSVAPPDVKYQISIPEYLIDNGSISALQLEAVIYACQMHQQRLPSGERIGYLIGDGAGVGKGRTVAAIIFENYLLGRKRSIWLSVSSDLKYDAERDLRDIGAGNIMSACT